MIKPIPIIGPGVRLYIPYVDLTDLIVVLSYIQTLLYTTKDPIINTILTCISITINTIPIHDNK